MVYDVILMLIKQYIINYKQTEKAMSVVVYQYNRQLFSNSQQNHFYEFGPLIYKISLFHL